ncbi:hypothetical protein [Marivita hallyeonensis]|uniref:Uncharacterized protein n=1 Tax=Marivita hallyeonensis TaxID=996342 RepID=A0A1M5TCF8_9RHOB|nr:hypothetical protein [Marivita hallyeonensis]SHH48412.1 hypothetical protein SAMN05443551_2171 [Marivita hallyeonensis]
MTQVITKLAAYELLAQERPMVSLIDRDILALGGDFIPLRSDWISLFYDTGHKVTSDDGSQYAFRAITTRGEYLWLVFSAGKTRGYHAETTCPHSAFAEAREALTYRRAVKSRWDDVRAVARALRRGKLRFDVLIEDAMESPLCAMGTRHFLRSFGLSGIKRISGFKLAWMMLIEPQLGFVIYQAALREGVLSACSQDDMFASHLDLATPDQPAA